MQLAQLLQEAARWVDGSSPESPEATDGLWGLSPFLKWMMNRATTIFSEPPHVYLSIKDRYTIV